MATVRELITKIVFKTDKNSLKTAEKSVEKLKQQLETVGKTAQSTDTATTSMLRNMMTTRQQAGNAIKTAMDNARRSVDGLKASALQTSGALNTVRASGGRVIQTPKVVNDTPKPSKMERAGNFATAGVVAAATGAAIVAPIVSAVENAKEFEYAMARVQAVTNADAEALKKLSEQARALGRSTEFNAKQVAEAQYYLGLAGWKTNAILAATPNLLRLSIAGGTDLARTADIISDNMTAMGIAIDDSGKSVNHFADIFAATMSNSNTTIEMMGESMKFAGTIAGTLGYSMEDVAFAIGLMANNGTKASEAGTALRAMMTRLAAPPKEAAEAFAQIAQETGIVISPIDKLTGKVKPLREVFIQLRQALKNYDEVQRVAFGKQIAGMYGTAGFNAIVKSTDADFNKLMNSIDNADGASQRMASTMSDNLRGSLIATKSAAYDLNVEIGKSLTPTLREASGMLTGFLNGATDLAKEFPRLTTAVSIFGAAVGGLLVGLGALGIAVGGIVTLAGAFGATVSAPVVAAVLGVIAVVAAIGANIDRIKAKFNELKNLDASGWIDKIKENLDVLPQILSNPLALLLQGIRWALGEIGIEFDSLPSIVSQPISTLFDNIKDKFDSLPDIVANPITIMIQALALAFGKIGINIETIKSKFASMKPVASSVLGFIKGLLDAIINPLGAICGLLDKATSGFAGLISKAESGAVQRYQNIMTENNQTNNITVSSPADAGRALRSVDAFYASNFP